MIVVYFSAVLFDQESYELMRIFRFQKYKNLLRNYKIIMSALQSYNPVCEFFLLYEVTRLVFSFPVLECPSEEYIKAVTSNDVFAR